MRIILSSLTFIFICCIFITCSGDEEQNGTDQNAPNTLESLINPGGNSANTTSVATVSSGSKSVQDIWVLTTVNSEQKYNVNLVSNTPVLDLDSAKRSMTGHTGCNSLSGKFRVQGNKLLFDSLRLTSSQPCSDKGFEKKLVSSLKSGNTTYRVANDSLFLSLGGAELVYRRIRRS